MLLGSFKVNWINNVKCYMNNSTVHGLKYIIDEEAHWLEKDVWDSLSNYVARVFPRKNSILLHYMGLFEVARSNDHKLFWILVCSLCVYGTVTVFIASWRSFRDNPVSFVVETTYLDWNTTFPAVTVCEKRNADKIELFSENYFGGDRNLNLDTFVGDVAFFSGTCSSCVYHCGTDIDCRDDLNFLTRKLRSPCKDILKDCKWNDQEFDCCKEFESIDTGFGECFTINSMQGRRWWQGNRSITLTSNRLTGPGTLTFSAQEDINVAIHSPEDILFNHGSPDQFAIIEYGQRLDMNFQVLEMVNDNNVRDISVESRNCRFPDENPLTDYQYYSYSACITECEGKAQMDYCGCMHHLMPKSSLSRNPTCNVSGLTCISNHQEDLKAVKNSWSEMPGLVCDCLPSCTEQEFKVLQSQVEDIEFPEYEGEGNSTGGKVTDYSLKVTIGMASLPTERLTRNVVRTRLDIVVSLGGTAGLFLGASLLSIVELVYYLFIRLTTTTGKSHFPGRKTRKMLLLGRSMKVPPSRSFPTTFELSRSYLKNSGI